MKNTMIDSLRHKLKQCELSCKIHSANSNIGKALRRRCASLKEALDKLEQKYPKSEINQRGGKLTVEPIIPVGEKPLPLASVALLFFVFTFVPSVCAAKISLPILAQIESSGNPAAYNQHSGARGLYQITDICRRDYNRMTHNAITAEQLFNEAINYKIASWYTAKRIPQLLRHYGIPVTVDNVLYAYNAGIGKMRQGIMPEETREYIAKYKKRRGETGMEKITLLMKLATKLVILRIENAMLRGQMTAIFLRMNKMKQKLSEEKSGIKSRGEKWYA